MICIPREDSDQTAYSKRFVSRHYEPLLDTLYVDSDTLKFSLTHLYGKEPMFNILITFILLYLSRLTTKPTKWPVRPATTQINLVIRPVRSESSLST